MSSKNYFLPAFLSSKTVSFHFWLCVLLSPLFSHLSQANFAAWDKPLEVQQENVWLTKESEHFVITYPKSNTTMADKALNIAERVHKELVPFFGQFPEVKTQMALVDDFDFSNGWATFFPFAQIRLFSSPPDSVNGLEVNDDWLHTLIRHEYVHVLHLEMERGAPKELRDIFGRMVLLFPHTITPSFMLEGLATYLETDHELGYGRLQGSFYAMQMREEVAQNRLKTLGDVAAPLREWPLGMQYLYGSYFYQYLADTYGEQVIRTYLYQYSGKIIPAFLQNQSMRRSVSKNFDQLWQEYHSWLKQKFSTQISKLEHSPAQGKKLELIEDKALFKDATNSHGGDFYYIHNNGEDSTQLRRIRAGKNEEIVASRDVLALDINNQGEVVISRMITWMDGRSWADLFLLIDEGDGDYHWQALTEKSRLRNVRWLNHEQMIASRKVNGISELVLINKQGEMTSIWRGQDDTSVIGDFDISANGEFLVAAMKRALQGWNLEKLNLTQVGLGEEDQPSWQAITDTRGIENSPQIIDENTLLYSADYDGIYNLYLLDMKSQQLTQLTEMLSGAFEPKLVENEVFFQAYTADGFEFRKFELENLDSFKKINLASVQGKYNYPKPFDQEVEKTEPQAYSPLSSLVPRWWFPIYSVSPEASQFGLMTGGSDTLARHNYSLQLMLDTTHELADMSLIYGYDNRYQLSFQRSHQYVNLVAGDRPELIIEQDRWILARNHIVNALEDRLSLNAAILVEREGSIEGDELFTPDCIDANFDAHRRCEKTLTGLGLQFDSREAYLNSPGFSGGRYWDLVIESNDVFTGLSNSDYSGNIIQGQWQEIFDLPGRRSLSWQVIAGFADEDNEDFTLGGEDRLSELSLFGRDDFALRGYPSLVQGGNRVNVNRVNFSQWLGRIDKGWGIWPIGAGDISTDLYVDYGGAWHDGDNEKYLTGVGIDINIEVLAFYNLMMPIRLSYAKGLDKELGEERFNMGISMPY